MSNLDRFKDTVIFEAQKEFYYERAGGPLPDDYCRRILFLKGN